MMMMDSIRKSPISSIAAAAETAHTWTVHDVAENVEVQAILGR